MGTVMAWMGVTGYQDHAFAAEAKEPAGVKPFWASNPPFCEVWDEDIHVCTLTVAKDESVLLFKSWPDTVPALPQPPPRLLKSRLYAEEHQLPNMECPEGCVARRMLPK